jgi:hypothetical protein
MYRKLKKISIIYYFLALIVLTVCVLGIIGMFFYLQKNTSLPLNHPKYLIDYRQVKVFEEEITKKGASVVYQEIKSNTTNESYLYKHNIAHLFGKALYKTLNKSGIQICDTELSFGCYHGLFVEAILNEGLNSIEQLDKDCQTAREGIYTACQHGIGHGLVEYFGRDHIDKALEQCKRIQKHVLLGCSSGVFMEYFFPAPISHRTNPTIDALSPFEICRDIDPVFVNSCIYEIPRLWKQFEPDFRNLIDRCQRLPVPIQQKSCYRGIGHATGDTNNPNPLDSQNKCNLIANSRSRMYCLSGATWFYSTLAIPDIYQASQILCKESSDEKACFSLSILQYDKL